MDVLKSDKTVLTLDAGGTNFVFSAIKNGKEQVLPITKKAVTDDLPKCLQTLRSGFEEVRLQLAEAPVAISFAFPGPADYAHGVIGDLPNFPCFRGGVPLGCYLEDNFKVPVHINNDGDLFAYGEAIGGALPYVNAKLAEAGSGKRYKNLLGVTFGTGFGGGVVVDNRLLTGDNGSGGDVWVFRNKKYPELICEESVSIRGIKRVYAQHSGEDASGLTPKDIFDIAEGTKAGDRAAALKSFEEFGEVAANTIAQAVTIVDGLVVIGGGITGAAKYFMPAFMNELNGKIGTFAGDAFGRMQSTAYNLEDAGELGRFVEDDTVFLHPGYCSRPVPYNTVKKTGVIFSRLGTSEAVALGAYAYAVMKSM